MNDGSKVSVSEIQRPRVILKVELSKGRTLRKGGGKTILGNGVESPVGMNPSGGL